MLDRGQLSFFARNGYVQVPALVRAEDCADLVAETWRLLPAHWRRDRREDWQGPVQDSCHCATVADRGGHLKFQQPGYQPLAAIERSFGPASACAQVVRCMLGDRLAPRRERGLYAIAPTPRTWRRRPPNHHIESHPVQVIALAYLADVPRGAGGLLVWPGSHRALYPLMGSRLEFVGNPAFQAAYDEWAARCPVELPGRRGDVVFIHHRLVHAPSLNQSGAIRFGFLCDYQRDDFGALCQLAPGPDPWEDWEGVLALPPEERGRAPDIAQRRRWWSWPTRRRDDAAGTTARDFANKRDASRLARARQPGDTWLLLADTPSGWSGPKLDPKGGPLTDRGLRVEVDGRPLASVSHNGFVARLPGGRAHWQITVQDAPCTLWLRVVSLQLPFAHSTILHAATLGPGTHVLAAGQAPVTAA